MLCGVRGIGGVVLRDLSVFYIGVCVTVCGCDW
jgi:hypothetical protein